MPTLEINGKEVEVGDDFLKLAPAEQDRIAEEIAADIGGAAQQAPAQPYSGGALRAGSEAIQAGLLGGYDDELAGAILAPIEATKDWFQGKGFDLKRGYSRIQQAEDAKKQARREAHPIASIVGELAGGLTLGGGAAKAGLTTIGRMGVVPGAMVEGGAYGALYGSGEAKPGERLAGALKGGAVGVGTGLVAAKLGNAVMNRRAGANVQASDALRAQANTLYDASEKAGVMVNSSALEGAVSNLRAKMAPQLRNEKLFGDTIGIIDYLDDAAKTGTLKLRDIDELRQVVGESISSADPRNQRTLMMVKDAIDDFTEKLSPSMATGNVKEGVKYLNQARAMYAQKAKQEVVEEIFKKAQNQATGFENGLRVHFRALANNKAKFKKFSRDEQNAILKVVRGGPVENLVRAFAWMAPQKTLGAVMTGLTAAEGGIGPASAMAGLGMAATKGAERATVRNVNNLQRTIQGIGQGQLPTLYRQSIPVLSGATSREAVRR